MGFDLLEALKGIAITAGLMAIFYFIVPFIFPDVLHQAWFLTVTLTVSNFFAIVFSWYYFSKTRCYSDEANLITMYGYKIFGGSATHLFIFIIRLSGNIVAAAVLILAPDVLAIELAALFGIKLYLLLLSFTTALYLYEMINNIFVVSQGVDFQCKERSLLCDTVKDPLFCDF